MLFTCRSGASPIACALLLTLSAATLLVHSGHAHLWDPGESRFAAGALEMSTRGEWITPRWNGTLQPGEFPLSYWLTLLAIRLLGPHEFAVRCWSAVASVATIGLAYLLARRLFDARVALWSGLMAATCLGFIQQGRTATPASLLALTTTLALYLIVKGSAEFNSIRERSGARSARTRVSWTRAASIHAVLSLATLAVGPLGMLLPLATWFVALLLIDWFHRDAESDGAHHESSMHSGSGPVQSTPNDPLPLDAVSSGLDFPLAGLWLERIGLTLWKMRLALALVTFLAVAGPWHLSGGWRTGDSWWPGLVSLSSPDGMASRQEIPGPTPETGVWLRGLTLLTGFYPWSIVIGALLYSCWRAGVARRVPDKPQLLCFSWLGIEVTAALADAWGGLGSAPLGNPGACYLPLAILTARVLVKHFGTRNVLDLAVRPECLVALLFGGALLFWGWTLTGGRPSVVESSVLWGLSSCGLVGCGFLAAVGLAARGRELGTLTGRGSKGRRTTPTWIARGAIAGTILFGLLVLRTEKPPQSRALAAALLARSPDLEVATYGECDPSWVFYLGRPLAEIEVGSAMPTGESGFLPRRAHRPTLDEFLRQGTSRYVIARQRDLAEIGRTSSSALEVVAEVPAARSEERLVVLSLRDPQTARRVFPSATRHR